MYNEKCLMAPVYIFVQDILAFIVFEPAIFWVTYTFISFYDFGKQLVLIINIWLAISEVLTHAPHALYPYILTKYTIFPQSFLDIQHFSILVDMPTSTTNLVNQSVYYLRVSFFFGESH